ncbi:MAG TPA: hypothetical protein DCY42_03400, partial [Chloroflexi bacterium]|nr:hypothetical protein [Chloroflexota bacterium]
MAGKNQVTSLEKTRYLSFDQSYCFDIANQFKTQWYVAGNRFMLCQKKTRLTISCPVSRETPQVNMNTIIETNKLQRTFGEHKAVDGITFHVKQG